MIGAGRIGSSFGSAERDAPARSHAGAYLACANTALVGLHDVDSRQAESASRRWGVPCHTGSIVDFLDTMQPDIVSICTPDSTHFDLTRVTLACDSVRGILLEKPMASRLDDARWIDSAARQRGVSVAVNYSRRWADGIRRVRDIVQGGQLGDLQTVSGHYANGWLHNGTHWIDLLQMTVGEVNAARELGRLERQDGDPAVCAEFLLTGGGRGIVMPHLRDRMSFFEMDIVGTLGRVALTDNGDTIRHYTLEASSIHEGFTSFTLRDEWRGGLDRSLRAAVEELSASCLLPAPLSCGTREGLAALAIAHGVLEAHGAWVRFRGSP